MKRPRIWVDFNEMVEWDLVSLSRDDTKVDSTGAIITFSEGLLVSVYEGDMDDDGQPAWLIADGTVERNSGDTPWAAAVKWCCRIDANGFRHEAKDD